MYNTTRLVIGIWELFLKYCHFEGAACVGQHLWLSGDSCFVNQTIRCLLQS